MSKYVIHIGPPKVGSKYLQTSLAAASPQLLEHGICYPTKLFSPAHSVWHRALADELMSGGTARLDQAFGELNAAGHRYVVLSFEGFFGLSEDHLGHLKRLIDGSTVRIVYYCRRWSERIPSLWKQGVKEGFVETLPQNVARALQEPVNAPDFNPRLVWDKFARVFGRDSIDVVSFNNLLDHEIDLVDHFTRTFLDGYRCTPPADSFTNESPDIFDTEILRALNAIHLRRTGATSDQVRVRFLNQRKQLGTNKLMRAMENDLDALVLNDHAQVFEAIHQQMQTYIDRLVSPEYGKQFFALKSQKQDFVRQNYLIDKVVINKLNGLYDQLFPP